MKYFENDGSITPNNYSKYREYVYKVMKIFAGDKKYFEYIIECSILDIEIIVEIEEYIACRTKSDAERKFNHLVEKFKSEYQYLRLLSIEEYYHNDYKKYLIEKSNPVVTENISTDEDKMEADPDDYMLLTEEELSNSVNNDETAVLKKY
ncbi:MAG TPA: hypothetical protein PLV83_04435 [Bacilli bacterium]|nr:hypothetical protein [Bacilli bacterium]